MKKKGEKNCQIKYCPPGLDRAYIIFPFRSWSCSRVSRVVERVTIRLGGCAQPGQSEEAVRGED